MHSPLNKTKSSEIRKASRDGRLTESFTVTRIKTLSKLAHIDVVRALTERKNERYCTGTSKMREYLNQRLFCCKLSLFTHIHR